MLLGATSTTRVTAPMVIAVTVLVATVTSVTGPTAMPVSLVTVKPTTPIASATISATKAYAALHYPGLRFPCDRGRPCER
jgi:hypothetical protein